MRLEQEECSLLQAVRHIWISECAPAQSEPRKRRRGSVNRVVSLSSWLLLDSMAVSFLSALPTSTTGSSFTAHSTKIFIDALTMLFRCRELVGTATTEARTSSPLRYTQPGAVSCGNALPFGSSRGSNQSGSRLRILCKLQPLSTRAASLVRTSWTTLQNRHCAEDANTSRAHGQSIMPYRCFAQEDASNRSPVNDSQLMVRHRPHKDNFDSSIGSF